MREHMSELVDEIIYKIPNKYNLITRMAGEITRQDLNRGSGEYIQIYYGTSEEFSVEPQIPVHERWCSRFCGKHRIKQPYVTIFPDATILGSERPIAVSQKGKIVSEVYGKNRTWLNNSLNAACEHFGTGSLVHKLLNVKYRTEYSSTGRIRNATLLTFNNPSYYHWLFDQLPKIRAVEKYEHKCNETVNFIVPSSIHQRAVELMKFAGIDPNQLIRWDTGELQVENFLVPVHRNKGIHYELSKNQLYWIRDRLCSRASSSQHEGQKRIYISREDAQSRHITNEGELLNQLTDIGFKKYVLSEMSIERQIGLFSSADVVMGPHGAGLSNIIFGNDLTVIEILFDTKQDGFFFPVAELFDHKHRPIFVENDGEYEVNVHDIMSKVDKLISD